MFAKCLQKSAKFDLEKFAIFLANPNKIFWNLCTQPRAKKTSKCSREMSVRLSSGRSALNHSIWWFRPTRQAGTCVDSGERDRRGTTYNSNYSDQSSVRILGIDQNSFKIQEFSLENKKNDKISTFSKISAKFRQISSKSEQKSMKIIQNKFTSKYF